MGDLGLILDKGMTTYFNILAWRIPMDRGAWQGALYGVAKGQTRLSTASTAQHSTGSKLFQKVVNVPALELRLINTLKE